MDNLNVVELKQEELQKIDGGIWPLIVGALIGVALTQDLDSLAGSFMEGYNQARS